MPSLLTPARRNAPASGSRPSSGPRVSGEAKFLIQPTQSASTVSNGARSSPYTSPMFHRTGSADLPLHSGRVPAWLATRMALLGRVIVETLVHHYGRDELLRRLAHPFWFQSFGAVMGMDWHSSGITTSVLGALKRGLAPLQHELGIHVCGGRGKHSRRLRTSWSRIGEKTGIDGDALPRASRFSS